MYRLIFFLNSEKVSKWGVFQSVQCLAAHPKWGLFNGTTSLSLEKRRDAPGEGVPLCGVQGGSCKPSLLPRAL